MAPTDSFVQRKSYFLCEAAVRSVTSKRGWQMTIAESLYKTPPQLVGEVTTFSRSITIVGPKT